MNKEIILSEDYKKRLKEILDLSWKILKTRFIEGKHEMLKEAPFQHHFANVISNIGETYCTKRDDLFLVDLETKCNNIKGKSKYIDITCSFPNNEVSSALELKFKTAKQGAQDHGRIDAFIDIEALELACKNKNYDFGRFYMITDSKTYLHKSNKGVGTVFTTYDRAITEKNSTFQYPSKGRESVVVNLTNSYTFNWEQVGNWYFLELEIEIKK